MRGYLMNGVAHFGPLRDAPDAGGSTPEPTPPTPTPPANPEPPKPSDNEARLLREVMENKRKFQEAQDALKRFEGIDPDQVRQLLTEREQAAQAARDAEERRLREAGDWEALQRSMRERHQAELEAARAEKTPLQQQIDALSGQLVELTVGASFAGSKFLSENTVLTPRLARAAYESHFEVQNGRVVGYTAPKGDPARQPIVNNLGDAMPFDEAMKMILDRDPDKDRVLRSTQRPGSGTPPSSAPGTPANPPPSNPAGNFNPLGNISAALAAGALNSKK